MNIVLNAITTLKYMKKIVSRAVLIISMKKIKNVKLALNFVKNVIKMDAFNVKMEKYYTIKNV